MPWSGQCVLGTSVMSEWQGARYHGGPVCELVVSCEGCCAYRWMTSLGRADDSFVVSAKEE